MKLVDTHAHLHLPQLIKDRDQVVQRALENEVVAIITLSTDLSSSKTTLELTAEHPSLFAAIGIHPTGAQHTTQADVEELKFLLTNSSKIVAVGEIGLDFYWDKTHYEAQYSIFRNMIQLARDCRLPVVIHNRSAHREMQWFLQEEGIYQLDGVMHCFSGDIDDARFYLEMGLHISFTANITYPDFRRLDVVRYVPLDRLLLETDSPYMTPYPLKKKRNEPANVFYVAEKIAELHSRPIEEIAEITTANAIRLFKLPSL